MYNKDGNYVIWKNMGAAEDGEIQIRWSQHISPAGDLISIGYFSQHVAKRKRLHHNFEALMRSWVRDHTRKRVWSRFKLSEVINDSTLLAYMKYGKEGTDWRWVAIEKKN